MSLREICHCGHDRLSHAPDYSAPVGIVMPRGNCMARGCDCKKYVNEFDPKPKPRLTRPKHPSWCECANCTAYAQDVMSADRKTDPWLPFFPNK